MAEKLSDILARRQLPSLTGLRPVFVSLVVLYHAGINLPAGIGVTGFFVLSGFLITWLLLREFDRTHTISFGDFYRRRALRIFPAYYTFLFVSICADLALGNYQIIDAIVPGLFYFVNYYNALNDHPSTSIAHAWSLAVEEQFYLVWPIVLLAILRKKRSALPWVLGGVISLVLIWRAVAIDLLGTSYVYNAFETRCDSLAVGSLLAVLSHRLDRVTALVARTWLIPPVLAAIWWSNDPSIRYTIGFTIGSFAIGVLMIQIMCLHRSRLFGWIESRPVTYIGTISYGIYLYHVFGLNVGHKLVPESPFLAATIGIVATLTAAAASYHLLECSFLKLRERWQPSSPGVAGSTELR